MTSSQTMLFTDYAALLSAPPVQTASVGRRWEGRPGSWKVPLQSAVWHVVGIYSSMRGTAAAVPWGVGDTPVPTSLPSLGVLMLPSLLGLDSSPARNRPLRDLCAASMLELNHQSPEARAPCQQLSSLQGAASFPGP